MTAQKSRASNAAFCNLGFVQQIAMVLGGCYLSRLDMRDVTMAVIAAAGATARAAG
jgi:hypothetical protein